VRLTAPRDLVPTAPLRGLKIRSEFLAAARARRVPAGSFLLQARDRADGESVIGLGFTCSKKVGNAVARNRAKRRLREAARHVVPVHGLAGWDYVLVGRHGATAERAWDALLDDLRHALHRSHS
jgi:ribonuclease P protein component